MTFRHDDVDALRPLTPPSRQYRPQEVMEPAQPPKRPALVTTAAGLMVVLTVYVLAMAGLIMYLVLSMSDDLEGADLRVFKIITTVVCVGYLLVGLGVIGLSLKVLRGWNWARFTTFAVYGVFFVCAGVGILGLVGITESFASMNGGTISTAEIQQDIAILFILASQMLIMLTTVVLLAMPVSGRWFKEYSAARAARVSQMPPNG